MTIVDELKGDPLGRGYASMTPAQIVSDLRTLTRHCPAVIDAPNMISVIDSAELAALNGGDRAWLDLAVSHVNNFNDSAVRKRVDALFPAGSRTAAAIENIEFELCSRLDELGLPDHAEADVMRALGLDPNLDNEAINAAAAIRREAEAAPAGAGRDALAAEAVAAEAARDAVLAAGYAGKLVAIKTIRGARVRDAEGGREIGDARARQG